jgi:hypothetical protein
MFLNLVTQANVPQDPTFFQVWFPDSYYISFTYVLDEFPVANVLFGCSIHRCGQFVISVIATSLSCIMKTRL